MIKVARVQDFIVVNVEIMGDDWVAPEPDGGLIFVPYTDESPAHIGFIYDPVQNIFIPPPQPELP